MVPVFQVLAEKSWTDPEMPPWARHSEGVANANPMITACIDFIMFSKCYYFLFVVTVTF